LTWLRLFIWLMSHRQELLYFSLSTEILNFSIRVLSPMIV
jgi:hypothetical protein